MNSTNTMAATARRMILIGLSMLMLTFFTKAQEFTDSLLLYMPFDGDALDISGNNNHGTLYNVELDTDRFGVPNKAYRFNGTNSYIDIAASPSMNRIQTSDLLSISAWIRMNDWGFGGGVFSIFERYNQGTDSGWLFEVNSYVGGMLFLADETGGTDWVDCDYTWNFDQWYNVCLTYDQAEGFANFYVDSVLVCATPYDAPINVTDTTAHFVIGRSLAGPDEYSNGLVDDYKIFNRVLTQEEIGNIYETGLAEVSKQNEVALFPNPANDFVSLKFADSDKHDVTVYDAEGRIVFTKTLSGTTAILDTSVLGAGIYNVHITGAKGNAIKRLVVAP